MKIEYLKKLAIRAKQRAKLLLARPDFQEDIIEVRIKFKMPPSGFSDDDATQKWHHEFYQSDDVYFKTILLKRSNEIFQLKKKKKYREAEDLQKQLNNKAPVNAFRIAIKDLLKKYKIPLRWEESIRRYILFNDLNKMWLPSGISLRNERDNDTDLEKLYIEIEDDTTLEDVKQSWQIIKHQQRQIHSRIKEKFQPIKKMDRDMKAYELDRQGKSLKEIAKNLSKKYGDVFEWYDVSKFIERHRKKLGMN